MRPIHTIVIHHSASPRSTTPEQIEGWHLDRGFSGIGYHFIIDEKGEVHRGRPIGMVGAHVKGRNTGTIGICITGDNTKVSHKWGGNQTDSLDSLVYSLTTVFGPLDIRRHSSIAVTPTECPGLTADEWKDLYRTLTT